MPNKNVQTFGSERDYGAYPSSDGNESVDSAILDWQMPGMNAHVAKSINMETLKNTLASCIRR